VALFGLSARLPFDERYRAFLEVAAGQVLRAVSARRVLLETQWQREQLYEVLMQAPVPICVLRSDELLVEMANPLYHQLVGHTELVGRPLLDGIPEARGQGFDVALRRVMESGQPLIGREILIRLDRDGDGALEETYFTFIYAPMRDRTGVANRVMIIAHDVTDQVLARRRIEESEEKIRRILAQVDAGISQVDMNGRFALMNDRYCEITGRTRDELRQLRMDAILHPDDRARHIEQLGRVLQEKTTFSVEERYVRPDGSLVWVQNSVSRVDDPRGHPQGVALVTVDITERKSAEDERDRLLEELSRTVRFSEMFVGILGHDLRNPLSAISTSATLLGRRAADDERFTKLVGRILGSVERMDRMISQLLDFTRIRIGNGIPLQCASVDLADVARAAVEEIESSCVRPIDVLTTGDTAGTWDRDRLTQLVSNLAANACQHGGDAPISIAVDGSEPDTVRLEVRNGGVIPADVMPSIFDPFRRATDRARGGSGLGLGLYITQQIALAHGGTIAAESRDERTRFVVELPRHAAQGDDRVFVTTASSPPPPNVGRT
jgi:PAS domain S-box-containing protein